MSFLISSPPPPLTRMLAGSESPTFLAILGEHEHQGQGTYTDAAHARSAQHTPSLFRSQGLHCIAIDVLSSFWQSASSELLVPGTIAAQAGAAAAGAPREACPGGAAAGAQRHARHRPPPACANGRGGVCPALGGPTALVTQVHKGIKEGQPGTGWGAWVCRLVYLNL